MSRLQSSSSPEAVVIRSSRRWVLLLCRSRQAGPSRRPPLRRRFRAWPEVSGERRTKQLPVQLRSLPPPPPGQAEVEGARGVGSNSQSSSTPLRRASRPGPKSAARGVRSKYPVQLCTPPPPPPGQAQRRRREVCKQIPRPAALPSSTASGQGPKSAAGGVESKLLVQLHIPSLPPPGQAQSQQREMQGSRFPLKSWPPPPPPPGQARSRRQDGWRWRRREQRRQQDLRRRERQRRERRQRRDLSRRRDRQRQKQLLQRKQRWHRD